MLVSDFRPRSNLPRSARNGGKRPVRLSSSVNNFLINSSLSVNWFDLDPRCERHGEKGEKGLGAEVGDS